MIVRSPANFAVSGAGRHFSKQSVRDKPAHPDLGIYFMHYNFVRIHQTLRVTPAIEAGVTSKLWEMSDLVKVLEEWEASRDAS